MPNLKYTRHLSDEALGRSRSAVLKAIVHLGSQQALAAAAGTEKNVITLWKRSERLPTYEQAVRIELATGIPRSWLRPDVNWRWVKRFDFDADEWEKVEQSGAPVGGK